MSRHYGMMVGFSDAIKWIGENTKNSVMKDRVMARLSYELEQNLPVKPTKYKTRYFDEYKCGNCGRGSLEHDWEYCPNCGFAIGIRP